MPTEVSALPGRHPIDPAVEVALGVPATGPLPPNGITATALDGGIAGDGDEPFSLWGSDGFTFGDMLDIINPLQHIPVVSTIYRAITGDDIAAAPKVAGGVLFGGVIGLVASIVDTAIEQITGQDAGEHILALLDNVESSGEVLVADEDDGFPASPVEGGEAEFTGGTEDVSGPGRTPGEAPGALPAGTFKISEAVFEIDRETSDILVLAATPAATGAKSPLSPRGRITPALARAPASAKTGMPAREIPDQALKLLSALAKAGVPLDDPRVVAAHPGLANAMPGVAAGGRSPFAGSNPALWLGSIAKNGAAKPKGGNAPTADRGVVPAMGRALDQYNRSSRLGAAGPRVKVNF